ncbi:MAG: nuclear transport factor 2 family protein [Ornithinibacter sp.]
MTDIPDHRSQWDAYGELWVIADVAARRDACDGVLATGCTYTDPSVHAEGIEEILAYMTQFQQNAPGGHFVTQDFLEHHDRSLARWTMVLGDGTVVGTGASFATYDADGALTSMTGFSDAPAGS